MVKLVLTQITIIAFKFFQNKTEMLHIMSLASFPNFVLIINMQNCPYKSFLNFYLKYDQMQAKILQFFDKLFYDM